MQPIQKDAVKFVLAWSFQYSWFAVDGRHISSVILSQGHDVRCQPSGLNTGAGRGGVNDQGEVACLEANAGFTEPRNQHEIEVKTVREMPEV